MKWETKRPHLDHEKTLWGTKKTFKVTGRKRESESNHRYSKKTGTGIVNLNNAYEKRLLQRQSYASVARLETKRGRYTCTTGWDCISKAPE